MCVHLNFSDYTRFGITVKNNSGSNSDIDNKSINPNLILLHMFSEYLQPRFNQHLADHHVSDNDPEPANCGCGLNRCLNAAACAIFTYMLTSAFYFP